MGQRLSVDRGGPALYLAAVFLLACRPALTPLVPDDATPVEARQVQAWVAATEPEGHTLLQFKWLFRNERSSAGGVGRIRIAGPDTLRLDARGPLGSGRMAAVVVGNAKQWAEPEEQVAQIVPDYTLLWAMLGVARLPEPGATLRGLVRESMTAWEYDRGPDTVAYAITRGTPARLAAEVRRAGTLVGRVETTLSDHRWPTHARLTVPGVPAQLDIEFVSTAPDSDFPPETWDPPGP